MRCCSSLGRDTPVWAMEENTKRPREMGVTIEGWLHVGDERDTCTRAEYQEYDDIPWQNQDNGERNWEFGFQNTTMKPSRCIQESIIEQETE